MAFYPIHQTLGQMNGTLFYSSNRTKEYRNGNLMFLPMSLLLSWILIAPKHLYGLDMGAKGLAFQMILIQLFSVNYLLYKNAKYLNISFLQMLFNQFVVVFIVYTFGICSKYVFLYLEINVYLKIALEFSFYLFLCVCLLYNFTYLIGYTKIERNNIINSIVNRSN